MTHSTTNRNVARASHVKRVTVPLEDGWSMVTHSSPRGRSNMLISHGALCGTTEQTDDLTRASITEEASKQAKQEHERLYPRCIVNGLTVEKLLEEYHQLKKRWDETLCAKQLEAMLGSRKWNVKEAFCLATSSFSFDWENRTRALWQLVLFMDVVQKVSRDGETISLFAQEPIFNDLDKSFLHALKITVLQGETSRVVPGDVNTYITRRSFVYAPFLQWNVLLPYVLKDKDPALYIGNDISHTIHQLQRHLADTSLALSNIEEWLAIAEKFRLGRFTTAIPSFELLQHSLEGLMIYWKDSSRDQFT
ncbi:uncharacterized protein K441DRAFT_278698 [Cenococcum geophilum 1.58]|uniref:uncharacterized protein n=1 Tax=Cenococcum geophilum 1.58 TaxID=794803 RepID=UPI00358E7217|nr:hypothetical protein K441DRAFT_278698 [Cenococcum geophilum 1.58]